MQNTGVIIVPFVFAKPGISRQSYPVVFLPYDEKINRDAEPFLSEIITHRTAVTAAFRRLYAGFGRFERKHKIG